MNRFVYGCAAIVALTGIANAGVIGIDFSFAGDGVTPLPNGLEIVGNEYAPLFSISSTGNNLGATVFDSSFGGPNDGGPDPDLIVGLGNLLMLQTNAASAQSTPGIFDIPNDSANGGSFVFDFAFGLQPLTIDLVDIDENNAAFLTLTDSAGFQRMYDVPGGWTNDIGAQGGVGFATLDLTTLADQEGENAGIFAIASQDVGFNAFDVVQLEIVLPGSGGIDNLALVPTPGTAILAVGAGLVAIRRRRN